MKEIHRTEIVITFRRVILISREEPTESAEMPESTPFLVANGADSDLDATERRRVLSEVVRILATCLENVST